MLKKLIPVAMLLVTSFASAQQAEVYWKKQAVNVKVANGSSEASFSSVFERVVLQHNYYECGFPVEPVVSVSAGTCYETVCRGGAGQSPAWDAFFSAKKAEKASRLASAIKGIGQSSAEALVNGGYFSSKPRSWEAFQTTINQAANAGVITQQVRMLVLSNYRNDNIANLGYAGGCSSTPYACDEVHVIQEGYYVQKTCDAPVEQVIDRKPMDIIFKVQNAVLLQTESESIVFNVSGELAETSMNEAYYNKYSFSIDPQGANQAVINVMGTARKQVALPAGAIQAVALVPSGPKTANLQLTVSQAVLPVNNQEELILSYEIKSCNLGFLPCGVVSWDKKETLTTKITSAMTSIPVSTTLPGGRNGVKMDVSVKLYKQNSVYHSAQPVSKNGEAVKLGK